MTKKRNTKLLLIAVIAIYAAIIVRFFMLRSGDDSRAIAIDPIGKFTPAEYKVASAFTINNNYRDPFLGTLPSTSQQVPTQKNSQPQEEQPSYFPSIRYNGIVSDADSNNKVISIVVNDKEYVIREGKTVDSVDVLQADDKTLQVRYKNTSKKIKLSSQ